MAMYFAMRVPPSNPTAADKHPYQNTTSRALPGGAGPRAPPTLRDASGARVGCVQQRRWVQSPRIGVL